jgi:hypothetical protein
VAILNKTEYELLYDLPLNQRGEAFEWLKSKSLSDIIEHKYDETKYIFANNAFLRGRDRDVFIAFVLATKATSFHHETLSMEHARFLYLETAESLEKAYNLDLPMMMKQLAVKYPSIYEELNGLQEKAGL